MKKNKLSINKTQIISNPKIELRSEFEMLTKALKAVSAFSGETIGHLVVGNNAVYLCSYEPPEDVTFKKGVKLVTIQDEDFKSLASIIENLVKSELDYHSSEDAFDKYAEECYEGLRVTSDISHDDSLTSRSSYWRAFAKVVPSWLTLEK